VAPITDIPEGYPMVTVRYDGPTAKHEVIGMATGKHYGRKQKGSIIHMDRADVEAYPEMFTVLASPSVEASPLPKLPEQLRAPEQVLRPSARPIVEVAPVEAETLDAPQRAVPPSSFVLDEPQKQNIVSASAFALEKPKHKRGPRKNKRK